MQPRLTFDMQPVESSQLEAIGYHAESLTLAIVFPPKKSGEKDEYHYQNVSADLFAEFAAAESKGSFFIHRIKKFPTEYPYTKVEAAPAPSGQRAA